MKIKSIFAFVILLFITNTYTHAQSTTGFKVDFLTTKNKSLVYQDTIINLKEIGEKCYWSITDSTGNPIKFYKIIYKLYLPHEHLASNHRITPGTTYVEMKSSKLKVNYLFVVEYLWRIKTEGHLSISYIPEKNMLPVLITTFKLVP